MNWILLYLHRQTYRQKAGIYLHATFSVCRCSEECKLSVKKWCYYVLWSSRSYHHCYLLHFSWNSPARSRPRLSFHLCCYFSVCTLAIAHYEVHNFPYTYTFSTSEMSFNDGWELWARVSEGLRATRGGWPTWTLVCANLPKVEQSRVKIFPPFPSIEWRRWHYSKIIKSQVSV